MNIFVYLGHTNTHKRKSSLAALVYQKQRGEGLITQIAKTKIFMADKVRNLTYSRKKSCLSINVASQEISYQKTFLVEKNCGSKNFGVIFFVKKISEAA